MPEQRLRFHGLWLTAVLLMALAGCAGVTMKNFETAEEQYHQSLAEFQKRHYLKAIDGFQKVIYNFSGSAVVDSAQYFMAMSYYNQKDYFMAASEFERLVNNFPGSPLLDDGQYMTGLCYYKSSPKNYGLDQAELIQAITALEDFVTDYPESELADDARATIKAANERLARKRYENGRMYFRLGYNESADIYFQMVIDEHTDTEWAAKALYYRGETKLRQKEYETAQTTFNNFLVIYPEHELAEKAGKNLAKIDKYLAEAEQEN